MPDKQLPTVEILIYGAFLMVAIALLGYVVHRVRKKLFQAEEATSDEFSLQQLRDLKARGEISEAEFEQLKQGVIAQYRGGSDLSDESR